MNEAMKNFGMGILTGVVLVTVGIEIAKKDKQTIDVGDAAVTVNDGFLVHENSRAQFNEERRLKKQCEWDNIKLTEENNKLQKEVAEYKYLWDKEREMFQRVKDVLDHERAERKK